METVQSYKYLGVVLDNKLVEGDGPTLNCGGAADEEEVIFFDGEQ